MSETKEGWRVAQIERRIAKYGLSARQADVLTLMALGWSNEDIAEELAVALPTLNTHRNAIYRALDVNSRLEATLVANGVTDPRVSPTWEIGEDALVIDPYIGMIETTVARLTPCFVYIASGHRFEISTGKCHGAFIPLSYGAYIVKATTENRAKHCGPLSAKERGRLGGLKGGPSRAALLSPERRAEIASIAAQTRWSGKEAQ